MRRNDEQNQVRRRDNPLWLSYLFVDNLGQAQGPVPTEAKVEGFCRGKPVCPPCLL